MHAYEFLKNLWKWWMKMILPLLFFDVAPFRVKLIICKVSVKAINNDSALFNAMAITLLPEAVSADIQVPVW